MPSFQRLRPNSKPPWDSVLVTVWQSAGRTVADAAAPDLVAEQPCPVPIMLKKAEDIRRRVGLARVMVVLDEDALWRPEWGELVDYA